jgi:hypothetical protein
MARAKQHCVYTMPPGQRPAQLLKCFRTKRAARNYARRERYTQIISRVRPAGGWDI